MEFTCHHCCRSNRVPEALAGRSTRCSHCRKLIVVPAAGAAAPPAVAPEADVPLARPVEADGTSANGLPAEFATLSPADATTAAGRRDECQRIINRIRIVLVIGGVAGTTAGAALGGGLDNPETMAGRAAGGFIGLLFGLSIGVIIGMLQASESRKNSAKKATATLAELVADGREPNLLDLLMLVLGLAHSQSLRRFDTGDMILVGVIVGAVAGAVVGAELAELGLEMKKPGWQGVALTAGCGAAGLALSFFIVYALWRPWRRLGEPAEEGAVRAKK
jgi:hypothetical protein